MLTNNVEIERISAPLSRFSLLDDMRVERGTKDDWDALHSLHYKAENLPAGPRYWRCMTADGFLAGVVVLSTVGLLHTDRHEIFPKLKPGGDTHFTNVHRARFLNDNFCRASRIVTDTLFRGCGVGYRMVNLAMRMEGKKYCEIISSMAKFNPFDVKAGFRHANLRHAHAYEKGVRFFNDRFDSHPADYQSIMEELNSMPEKMREGIIRSMREFYYRHSAREKTGSNLGAGIEGRVSSMTVGHLLRETQQLVFASPIYGIWKNPDHGRVIPTTLPLRAFDLQGPNEPLKLEELSES